MIEKFRQDVKTGLTSPKKFLSSKYFYDKIGDALFVEIMNLEEYYLTDCEMDIFCNKTQELANHLLENIDEPFELIELGAGDGSKTIHLLKHLLDAKIDFEYIPIDISQNSLNLLESKLTDELPHLRVNKMQGDYFEVLPKLKKDTKQKVVLFLGSNIGNLNDDESSSFLFQLGSNLNQRDKLVLGVDLIKPTEVVLPAYDDAKGVTAKFNLNLLTRINNELGADFDLSGFKHAPEYDENEGIATSYIESTCDQMVTISSLNLCINFEAGEKIFTEISRKYDDQILAKILKPTNFEIVGRIDDSKNYFANYFLIKM
jgi:dimethylhistidine N-methyltransferase